MPKKLRVPDEIVAFIRGCHPLVKRKIKAGLKLILDDPDIGKSLKEDLAGLKCLRVGRFRIVYAMSEGNIIEVVAVGPRISIYEETYRILAGGKKPS